MANKNQVTLTFAGDSKDLEKSFDKVGDGAKNMGREVAKGADSFDRVGERADVADTRAMGFRDTLTGLEDSGRGFSLLAQGQLFDGLFMLGMGFGDLASGVANFGVQFVRTAGQFIATQARMVGVHMANASRMAVGWLIAMGPIALVVAAIAGIIAILVALGVDFDTIKGIASAAWNGILAAGQAVWNWLKSNWPLVLAILTGPIGLAVLAISRHWTTIRNGFSSAVGWIKGAASGMALFVITQGQRILNFFTSLPGRIASAFSGFGRAIVNAAKSVWNSTIGGLGFGGQKIGPVRLPRIEIPRLHQGGIVPGAPGSEMLTILQAGERVSPAGAGAGGPSIVLNIAGSVLSERDLVAVVRRELDRGGLRRFR